MKLELEKFGGIVPGTDPHNLPANAAQTARDVDLSEGTLKPWGVTNAFRRLHDDAGDMVAGFPATDIAIITKATKITLDETGTLDPGSVWGGISIDCFVFITWIDADGEFQTHEMALSISEEGEYRTTDGFTLYGRITGTNTFEFHKGITYRIHGPKYQIEILGVAGLALNTVTIPAEVTVGSAQIPLFQLPIYTTRTKPDGTSRTSYQFGTLECLDVNGPQVSGSYEVPDDAVTETVTQPVISGDVDFSFTCNYVRNRAERVYYVQQNVDTAGRDGPESDVSDEIQIRPGQYVKLTVPGSGTRRVYRSANSSSGFALIGEVTGSNTAFYDDYREALTKDLPPNGNVPHASTAAAVKGALRHPAGYFVYFNGADLRPSSEWIDAPRPWAVPLEYAYTFDSTIKCLALSGGTILVFTQDAVYQCHGQDPGRLAVYRVSDKPILDKRTLWQDDTTVGWCNLEGIVMYDGGAGRLVTGDYMRANAWNAYTPASFQAKMNDKALCLFGSTNLRFDFRGDRTAAISTFTVSNGTAPAVWKSKVFDMPKPTAWYAFRMVGTGSAVLKLYADGMEVCNMTVTGQDDNLLPRMPKAWHWEVELQTSGEIRSFTLATNRREL